MTARRRPGPPSDGRAADARVRFTFDGREYEGVDGEPLAVALLAADRVILSRSFRFHRPRGLMCSTGACGWCECEVDGRPSVRSCQVPVRAGLVARGEHAFPSVERDLLSAVGAFARWIPPTFYHHRFLRPKRLRKRYLDVLRWFGGRGRLRSTGRDVPRGRPLVPLEPDVLVVGGGRAGLLAALGAAEAGAHVLVIEAEAAIGAAWGVGRGTDRRPGTVHELAGAAAAAGVEIRTGVTATGWYDGMVAAIGTDAHFEIRARAVVAATGSYDRVPLVPGADRPGVLPARTVCGLLDRHGVLPGERALLVGSGQELATAGELLAKAGAAEVIGPVPTASLVAIRGRRRVTAAVTRGGGRTQRHRVDLVVFGDRSPNLDLILAAGAVVRPRYRTLVPVADSLGRTTVPSLYVVGSAAGWIQPAPGEADDPRMTGRAAASLDTAPRRAANREGHDLEAHTPANAASGAIVCFCEDVRVWEVRAELVAGYGDPELVKRRTGALTGPCQGKSCLQAFACLAGSAPIPTARPPLRPVRLGDLVRSDPAAPDADPAAVP